MHLIFWCFPSDNFKALESKDKDKEKTEEDKEFESQRQASIQQALQAKDGSIGTNKFASKFVRTSLSFKHKRNPTLKFYLS